MTHLLWTDELNIQMIMKPGTVAHICNPSYSGGENRKDGGSRPARAKVSETPSQSNSSDPSMWEAVGKRILA
jgi:hypothetical protein